MPHDELMPSGYDEEGRYFHERDLELIRQKRADLDAARRTREQEMRRNEHWMKCPKCGADLQEVEIEGVMVDKCGGCGGMYLDKGEMELMLQTRRTWKSAVRKLLGR